LDKNKHLDSVISTHQITKEETLFDKYVKKKNEVKEALEDRRTVLRTEQPAREDGQVLCAFKPLNSTAPDAFIYIVIHKARD